MVTVLGVVLSPAGVKVALILGLLVTRSDSLHVSLPAHLDCSDHDNMASSQTYYSHKLTYFVTKLRFPYCKWQIAGHEAK